MKQRVKIGIVGDFKATFQPHTATNEALFHAADVLGVSVEVQWLPTVSLEEQTALTLRTFDAVWCSPGSPYQSMTGALQAIHFAREQGWPFIGT